MSDSNIPTPGPSPVGRGDLENDPELDPEIAAILDFEPAPRRFKRSDGWTAPIQRKFIARLAVHGSPGKACEELGKHRSGVDKVYKSPEAAGFRDAWAKAVELAEARAAERIEAERRAMAGVRPPFVDNRRKPVFAGPLPGQVLNEHGEWEDEESFLRRGEEARDSISAKLLNCRRLYLAEISSSPGKRAAFEILTELPIDWDKAARMEAQDDEPWRKPNMRKPDMLLTAENGWMGDVAYGEDKKAELRKAIDEHRAAEGLEPVNWDEDDAPARHPRESGNPAPPAKQSRSSVQAPDPIRGKSRGPSPTPRERPGPRVRGL